MVVSMRPCSNQRVHHPAGYHRGWLGRDPVGIWYRTCTSELTGSRSEGATWLWLKAASRALILWHFCPAIQVAQWAWEDFTLMQRIAGAGHWKSGCWVLQWPVPRAVSQPYLLWWWVGTGGCWWGWNGDHEIFLSLFGHLHRWGLPEIVGNKLILRIWLTS